MKQAQLLLIPLLLGSLVISAARTNSVQRFVDLKTPDGTILKASYFATAKPGPGVLLFHQSNRTRKSWTDTEEYRGEIRRDAQQTLKKLSEKQG